MATFTHLATAIGGFLWLLVRGQYRKPGGFWDAKTHDAKQLEQLCLARKGTMGQSQHAMVAACFNRSVDIGLAILKDGGNATDAFIATTFADYVQTNGCSSLGGSLGVLVYAAETQQIDSLVAPLKTVKSPTGQWQLGETALGKKVLVPGALAGLEALHQKYGSYPWRDLVLPAAKLAREGFEIDFDYTIAVNVFAEAAIKRSTQGRDTYCHDDGRPLIVGEILKLPILAQTLEAIAEQGSDYFYRGEWAKEAIAEINREGGEMSLDDLADYSPEWSDPLHITYRGKDIYSLNGHNSGGVKLLLALKVLEHTDIKTLGHYAESLDGLETLIRISRAVLAEAPLCSQKFYDDPQASQNLLNSGRDRALWQNLKRKLHRTLLPSKGSHSYSVAVVDAQGNSVTGTHTIESLPFGSGIFVGGIPLNNTAIHHPSIKGNDYTTPPGSYIIEPFSASFVFENQQLVLSNATFNVSLFPADFQLVVSAIDFDWNPERIALTPRFGYYAYDLEKLSTDISKIILDPRFSLSVINHLRIRNLGVAQGSEFDTGSLVMIKRDPITGLLTGFTPESLSSGKVEGY
jgi:gamma-glutamyltranspeptidase / glutathione hydrolase